LDPLFDEEMCAAVNVSWTSMFFRADQPGATQEYDFPAYQLPVLTSQRSTYWENGNASCYINFQLDTLCEQGLVPAIVLDTHSLEDVQKGVNFAQEH
jgi:hypothetical protein